MKLIKHEKVNSCMTDPLANLSVIGCFQIAEETVTELMGKLKIDGITVRGVSGQWRYRLLKAWD